MLESIDYRNCKVIIHDDVTGATVAETTIIEYNKSSRVISIDPAALTGDSYTKVSLLIFFKNALIECKGTVRKDSVRGMREIALYAYHEKESRESTRYDISTTASVRFLLIEGQAVPLNHPLTVSLCNISTSGALIETDSDVLNPDIEFLLELDIAGTPTRIHTSVTRIIPAANGKKRLGCMFVHLYAFS